ncbi:hypothetical protein [Mumia sp. Pv 4-285]|uniref:hypothetical protein n=1 Tax=Mumia qirimensis TaxID=3234852 RepID=UPI00351D238D
MTTTVAAAVSLVLALTGLPDALAIPVLALLLAAMVAGVLVDWLVRRSWRRTSASQRRWLDSLEVDVPSYRARVDDRDRALFGWESRWWRPLGTVVLLGLSAALVPFNVILPLAPEVTVEPLVTVWVTVTLMLTLALVVRSVGAARLDSRGLVLPVAPTASVAPAEPETVREQTVDENVAKYLVVEEEVAPEIQLAREIERLTALLDEPGAPRPSLPIPADWLPVAEPEPTPVPVEIAVPAVPASEAHEPPAPATAPEAPAPPADELEPEPDAPKRSAEGELDKLAKWFHAA